MVEIEVTAEKRGFDSACAGKRAECDGGGPIPGTRMAGRQDFAGTLTGEYREMGDPPWRWYRMVDLVEKPAEFDAEAVWCLQGNLYVEGED
ncbi:MAG: hypothetical protein CL908_24770 [Deltaproteobacteria bacterium]|nr:hypothetical protein [Deltaproteobacteria bacterium]